MSEKEATPFSFGSFAKTFATLQKLTRMESAISAAIKTSKVPPIETRRMLRSSTTGQVEATPLFQFISKLFWEIGLGELHVTGIERFKMIFQVKDSPIVRLYDVKDRKTCYITCDALEQFFTKDLVVPAKVEETSCENDGAECCEFTVELQPLPVYQIALDDLDKKILEKIIEDKADKNKLINEFEMEPEEIDYRLNILQSYHIIDESNNVTEIGNTYHQYGGGILGEDEKSFSPPWDTFSKVSSAIAASKSFAEAVNEAIEEEPVNEIEEEEVINLAEEAKKSQSFAELISKQFKDNEDEENNGGVD
jgi:hypothetical protein